MPFSEFELVTAKLRHAFTALRKGHLPLVNRAIAFPLRIFTEAVDNFITRIVSRQFVYFFHIETNNLYNIRIVINNM